MRTLLSKVYAQHAKYRFWAPAGCADDVEWSGEFEEAYRIARYMEDRTLHSPFLARLQGNPALERHFSAQRCNILRPFATFLRPGIRVLELGCECGPITRYLGESGAEVCAVEPDMRKAAVAVLRCRDLNNVAVICDAIANLPVHLGKFDMVTLVGPRGATLLPLLQKARTFLRKNGVLLLATGNRFGLKQFAGVPNQELCWSALTDASAASDTNDIFSRKEVTASLNQAGFTHSEQFVPIGDHRNTSSVLLPNGLLRADAEGKFADLFDVVHPFEENLAMFNLQATWHNIIKAGLLHELADSLCFLASTTDLLPEGMFDPHVLAVHFGGLPNSDKRYGKDVALCDIDGTLTIQRRPWFTHKAASDADIVQVLEDEPYHEGHLLMHDIRQAFLRPGWTIDSVAERFRPWVELLVANRDDDDNVPGSFLDCCPINIIIPDNEQDNGAAVTFDLEWQTAQPVPYGVVLVRGILVTLERLGTVAPPQDGRNIIFGPLIRNIANHFDSNFADTDLASLYDEQNVLDNFLTPERPLWNFFKCKTIEISCEGLKGYYAVLNERNSLRRQRHDIAAQLTTGNA